MARVVLRDIHVDFPIYGTQHLSLRNTIYRRATGGAVQHDAENNDRVVVRALSGISLELQQGDRLGLIGHNGAGKSTLLKAIAGIYEPVRGSISIEGRVTPLFDMMPGLDVEDTGYENIFTSGMLLGMDRDYIDRKIPEIEEFSELGEYLSLPVRTYSAGMTTRLGFALVTALNPDVLLMDEGFGAADLRFAERSAERMDEFIGRSRIIILASHSDSMIASICNKAAWLSEGCLLEVGPVEEIFEKYHESVHRDRGKRIVEKEISELVEARPISAPQLSYNEQSISDVNLADRRSRTSGDVVFTRLVAKDATGATRWQYQPGEKVSFVVEYKVVAAVPDLALLFRICLPEDQTSGRSFQVIGEMREILSKGHVKAGTSGSLELTLPNLVLAPNKFSLYVCLGRSNYSVFFDVLDTNVPLPELIITTDHPSFASAGVVLLDYKIKTGTEN
jgi:ABC-type polysaccharide/polyol phosphate transport system ATPase subunit